jgi:SAM-dependent methyltransferase
MIRRDRVAPLLKRHRRIHRVARQARFALGRLARPRALPGIPGRVHFNDFMLENTSPEEVASYAERARNVIALIEESLTAVGRTFDDVERWLDFGCGYGRVVRFLAERVPPSRIFVSDVGREGVDFCRSEFGVNPIYSRPELDTMQLGLFEFIYAVSVVTHLNEHNTVAFLRLLGASLAPGGILLFTTHGQWSAEHPELYGAEYGARKAEIETAVRARGLAYYRYPFEAGDYGITWHSKEYIERTVAELHGGRLAPLLFKPQGLDGHQDVFAFRLNQHRSPDPGS